MPAFRPWFAALCVVVSAGGVATAGLRVGPRTVIHRMPPQVARKGEPGRIRSSATEIEQHRLTWLKLARKLGRDPAARRTYLEERRQREDVLRVAASAIREHLARTPDERGTLIALVGPDGLGKSSTIRRIKMAYAGVRKVRVVHWRTPRADESRPLWIQRYLAKLPGPGEVVIWDRSYVDSPVYEAHYGLADDAEADRKIAELNAFESLIADRMNVAKFYLEAPRSRVAKTIAKREVIGHRLSPADYLSFRDYSAIRGLFRDVVRRTGKAIPWHTIPFEHRLAGRIEVFEILKRLHGVPSPAEVGQ